MKRSAFLLLSFLSYNLHTTCSEAPLVPENTTEIKEYLPALIMIGIPVAFLGCHWYQCYKEDQKTIQTVLHEAKYALNDVLNSPFMKDYEGFIKTDDTTQHIKDAVNSYAGHAEYPFTCYHTQLSTLLKNTEHTLWAVRRRLSWLEYSNEHLNELKDLERKLDSHNFKLYGYNASVAHHKLYQQEQDLIDSKKKIKFKKRNIL